MHSLIARQWDHVVTTCDSVNKLIEWKFQEDETEHEPVWNHEQSWQRDISYRRLWDSAITCARNHWLQLT